MKTVVFIHGWATGGFVWREIIEGLKDSYKCVSMGLPSHQGSMLWDEPSLAPAVKEMAGLFQGLKDKDVVAIGWSLGAEALIEFSAQNPGALKGIVLAGATPCFTERQGFPWGRPGLLVKRMLMDMKKDPAKTLSRFYRLLFTDKELEMSEAKRFLAGCEEFQGSFQVSGGLDHAGVINALEALYRADLRGSLEKIKAPALVVHGSLDSVVALGAGEFLASRIKGARLKPFEGAGHAPFITIKDRFLKEVKGFVDALRA
ncbi:MAG: alpha/beta fold hydrolase [Deltaproteobacteria bacterium]|nr:alpha/beta fold hydrolase [Deltaproteobacteria bacterium]